MFIKESLESYIDEINSKSATPGGGSVSALIGAMGAALSNMVGHLSIEKKFFAEYDKSIREKFSISMDIQQKAIDKLKGYVDEDTKAFDGVIEAFKLPKNTEEEKNYRNKMIQEGYKEALEVPLLTAKTALAALEAQEILAKKGNVQALSDVGVGVLLLSSGIQGALYNVRINLKSITDQAFAAKTKEEIFEITKKRKQIEVKLFEIVERRLEEE